MSSFFMSAFFRVVLVVLSVLLGATFLYSAYTKLYPIQAFEYTMVEFMHLPWLAAALAARFFIGLEATLGALIALHLFGKNKIVLKGAFALLLIFSVYLIILWAMAGNGVNCGCFGDAIWMSPAASLIKNAILLLITGLLLRFHKGFAGRWVKYAIIALFACGISLPYILYAIPGNKPSWLRSDKYKMDFSVLYAPDKTDAPAVDLSKGKHVVAFFSPNCPHCKIAAYKMHLMKQSDTTLPFFMVIGGTTSDLTDFWKKSRAQNLPYTRLAKEPFLKYTGGVFPLIVWVKDGMVEAKDDYIHLNQDEIEKWLKE